MKICLPNKFKKYKVLQDTKLVFTLDNCYYYLDQDYAQFLRDNHKDFELIIKAGSIIKFQNLIVRLEYDIMDDKRWGGLDITLYRNKNIEDPSVGYLAYSSKNAVALKLSKALIYQLDLEEINP